jgi:hypothetical protein
MPRVILISSIMRYGRFCGNRRGCRGSIRLVARLYRLCHKRAMFCQGIAA